MDVYSKGSRSNRRGDKNKEEKENFNPLPHHTLLCFSLQHAVYTYKRTYKERKRKRTKLQKSKTTKLCQHPIIVVACIYVYVGIHHRLFECLSIVN